MLRPRKSTQEAGVSRKVDKWQTASDIRFTWSVVSLVLFFQGPLVLLRSADMKVIRKSTLGQHRWNTHMWNEEHGSNDQTLKDKKLFKIGRDQRHKYSERSGAYENRTQEGIRGKRTRRGKRYIRESSKIIGQECFWAANQLSSNGRKRGVWGASYSSAKYRKRPNDSHYLPSGGEVPGNAACGMPAAAAAATDMAKFVAGFWPGKLNCGRKLAKLIPAKGSCPLASPAGNELPKAAWACCWAACWLWEVANRDRIERSDICKRCATGGILAKVAGNRETSDFMSERSSSSWFNTLWSTALAGLFPTIGVSLIRRKTMLWCYLLTC